MSDYTKLVGIDGANMARQKRSVWETSYLYRTCHTTVYHLSVNEWVSSEIRPHQHSIDYTGDGFYRSKDPTNSIKVLNEMLQKRKKTTKTTKYTHR